MATSTIGSEYEFIKRKVCIKKRNSQYEALRTSIMSNDKDVAYRKVQEIVTIAKRFEMALALEEEQYNNTNNTGNRTTTYCGDTPCQTLPYSRNWYKDKETTRSFIPTAYHILQEYDLLYLKAKISFENIQKRNTETIANWASLTHSDISLVGKKIGDAEKKLEYYNSCINTINQIIALRNYDKDICNNGIDTDGHISFIKELRQLESDVNLLKPVHISKLITKKVSQGQQKKIFRNHRKSDKKKEPEFKFSDLDNNKEKEDRTL